MNLMQFLSVSGTLEGPREKFLSRRIGRNQDERVELRGMELANPEPAVMGKQPLAGQGEFGFFEPIEVESKPICTDNHLGLGQVEVKPKARDHVEVYSRLSPVRVRVVRNDLAGSDLVIQAEEGVDQFRPSLISEDPLRSSWSERVRGRFKFLERISRWVSRRLWRWLLAFKSFWPVGVLASISRPALNVVPEPVAKPDTNKAAELEESIEVAKDYKTDVYEEGKVVWSYEEYAASVMEIVPKDAHDL